eukprot:5189921-Amphidinium_carterae.1
MAESIQLAASPTQKQRHDRAIHEIEQTSTIELHGTLFHRLAERTSVATSQMGKCGPERDLTQSCAPFRVACI